MSFLAYGVFLHAMQTPEGPKTMRCEPQDN